jgi:hypothetical protein
MSRTTIRERKQEARLWRKLPNRLLNDLKLDKSTELAV